MADALSKKYTHLSTLEAKILEFDTIQEFYKEDEFFQGIVENPKDHDFYVLQDGFLFKHNKLCLPMDSLREFFERSP